MVLVHTTPCHLPPKLFSFSAWVWPRTIPGWQSQEVSYPQPVHLPALQRWATYMPWSTSQYTGSFLRPPCKRLTWLNRQFAYNQISFMIIRLLQRISTIVLEQGSHPESMPPPGWADSKGSNGKEKLWLMSHTTLYVQVRLISSLLL